MKRGHEVTVTPALALNWEDVPWTSDLAQRLSRTQRAKIHSTYKAAIPADISTMPFAVDPQVAAEADDARDAIARFDAELSTMFADAEFAPLSSVLLRTESASSSQIENITTGARALALAEIGFAKYGSNAELVAANVDAMNRAVASADKVTLGTILDIHEALMRGQDHANPGRFRDEQVWIGASPTPHGAVFVPPHHGRVQASIHDLCAFTTRTDIPLLTQAALAHAQFETIHPFNDGNGRTGRALVHALLKGGGATTRTTLPVSAGLLNTPTRTSTRSPPTGTATPAPSSNSSHGRPSPPSTTVVSSPTTSTPPTRTGRRVSPPAATPRSGVPYPSC